MNPAAYNALPRAAVSVLPVPAAEPPTVRPVVFSSTMALPPSRLAEKMLPEIVVPARLPPFSSMPLLLAVIVRPENRQFVEVPRNFRPLSKCVIVSSSAFSDTSLARSPIVRPSAAKAEAPSRMMVVVVPQRSPKGFFWRSKRRQVYGLGASRQVSGRLRGRLFPPRKTSIPRSKWAFRR